ncbi:DUF4465 domain-containing protein [Planctomycetota bacterium]
MNYATVSLVLNRAKYLTALAAIGIFTCASHAEAIHVDFEDLEVFTATGETGSYFNGNASGASNSDGWSSAGVRFGNSYSSDFGGFWSGWSYSTISDADNGSFTNQYATVTGGGHNSETYAVGFGGDSLFFDVPEGTLPQAVNVTNTTYAAATIIDGNMFSKPFGGETGADEDFFSVVFTGMSETSGRGEPTGQQEFFLADYRSSEDYIVNTWEEIDLTALGAAKSVKLSFTSSDVGDFGINTPSYIAIDNLKFATMGLRGDFDSNGQLDVEDIDALTLAVRDSNPSGEFDLDANGNVDQEDRAFWVHELKNTYFGDANLDGEFNTADLTSIFQSAQYEDSIAGNSTWEQGDWNGDGDFETGDLVLAFQDGGFEIGPRIGNRIAVVPEPSGVMVFSILLLTIAPFRRLLEWSSTS